MLYQQGTQRIEVIVRKDSGASIKGANERGAEQAAEEQTSSTSSARGSSAVSARFIRINTTHTLAVAKQIGNTSLNYIIQGLGDKYGDQALQENMERRFEIVQDATNFASSVAMGAAYGSAGGPFGAAIGAVLGAVSSGVSLAFKFAGRQRDFEYKVFKENNAIEYQRARASINLTTGRLR